MSMNGTAAKRAIDLLGASMLLVATAPLLLGISIVIGVVMGRPILFRQLRTGLHGRAFELIKFRTMTEVSPSTSSDAVRLTRVGRWLRSSSLDELPQLWNVLRGEMSLVGPRPLLPEYLPLYSAEQARRHEVRPGITGLAQVQGRNAINWDDKFILDTWYVDNHTLLFDLKILGATVLAVIMRRGINQPHQATAEPFRGSTSGGNMKPAKSR